MKNTYGDADIKDSTEIAAILRVAQLENELATLRAKNAQLRERLEYALEALKVVASFGATKTIIEKIEATLNSTKSNPLYTAAPEMLEALEECLPIIKHFIKNHDFVTTEKAEAAIAKAKSTIPA